MTDNLQFAVTKEYFEQIKSGEKKEEYRLVTPYWTKRIDRRMYKTVTITLGYPRSDDAEKILRFYYDGYQVKTITHKHFGPVPVRVYAIALGVRK